MRLGIRRRLTALLARIQGRSEDRPANLLPTRQPPFAQFRPGRQHCQIHDPDYLQDMLRAERDATSPEAKDGPS